MYSLQDANKQPWLPWFLRGLLLLGFLVIVGRLFELQIIRGSYFRALAEGNRIRRVTINAPRGKIVARGGEVLIGNKEAVKTILFDAEEGYKKVAVNDGNVDNDHQIIEWTRDYKIGSSFAHAGGYLGEVNPEELGKINPECPEKGARRVGNLIGRTGLESQYDCFLAGTDGEELIEVDAMGKLIRVLGKKEPIPGNDLKTTIDYGLQKEVSTLFPDLLGAAIVTDTTGEVLAFYSSPSYDPNVFIVDDNQLMITKIFADTNLPLFNRVIGGLYHPGSVFKPIIALSALEEGVIDKDFEYEDTGKIVVDTLYGSFSYSNWYFSQYGGVEGKIKLTRALARSTDTFFYKLGELMGIERINKWTSKFRLDNKTGVDIPGEVAGLVPSPDWKITTKGEKWFLGNTYHIAIGQGDLAVTPLGIHSAISVIANAGDYCQPHILGANETKNRQFPIPKSSNFQCQGMGIKAENIKTVKEGMMEACSDGGTGYTFFDFSAKHKDVSVACKTGTAEIATDGKTHAWFTAFTSNSNNDDTKSQIVVTVLVEEGGEGSKVAGPIARKIVDYWFSERN